MSIGLTQRLRRLPRWLRNKFAPGGLILTYHRVAEPSFDPYGMCVTPRRFAEHLEVVKKYGRPVPLRQLVRAVRAGECPHRAVAVTFDDGYADNLHVAKPLLERYGIPATVFVATKYVERGQMFWWDELAGLLIQTPTLPGSLRIQIGGGEYGWELGEAVSHYCAPAPADGSKLDVLDEADATPRHKFFRSVYHRLRPLPDGERREALDALATWAGGADARPHRTLSQRELLELTSGGLVEIGAHTITHPALSTLPASVQSEEIQGSKRCLEAVLGGAVDTFAYPHGDHSALTAALVREAGFSCACTTRGEVIWQGADPFRLPRLGIGDWDGEEVEKLLRWMALG